ncbi:MAG: quinone oxidoreductase [Gemmatimonadaceae bacterium]|nr:quinone oxidoreductase [Gemmatimonadaceae bacterium]
MRAMRVHAPGGPDALREEQIPVPAPGPGEVRVRVAYAGVNFIDAYKRSGAYDLARPATVGEEGAGVVDAVGSEVTEVQPGDRVAWAGTTGAFAELALVRAAALVPVPTGVTLRVAAAVMLQGLTAHYLACSVYPLSKGDRCVVHAAAGGVGLLLVQIARRRGATVIGTAGSEDKAELARAAGADHVVLYQQHDFAAAVQDLTDRRGVHVVYDSVGRTTFLHGLTVLAPRGMMVLFGQSSGAVEPVDPQLLNRHGSLFLTRPTLANYIATRDELLWRAGELFEWIGSGELDVRIGAEFALAEVADAHRALEGRRTTGKVLLRVDPECDRM